MLNRILAWFQDLPAWGTGLIMAGVLAGVVGGGVAGYRTYEYVEHDNEFCLSCHLMEEPFERFGRSAHRGLGCKACHKPTFAARSQMALTQILENPDTLATHAEVPNEKCAGCHIEGDPETWEIIRTSAGHRIHFESDDPSLEGLNCVQCHSSGVHEFAAVSQTCAQSGCHTDARVQLGGMSDLTIHCVACHAFNASVETDRPAGALTAAVTPEAEECLSCHVMRTLVDMPPDEPHGQRCGVCHNPHEQSTPEQAVESCATADCHSDAAQVSPMHRGLEPGVLEDCGTCHVAHDWDLEAETCLSCHQDVIGGSGTPGAGGDVAARPFPHAAGLSDGAAEGGEVRLASRSLYGLGGLIHAPGRPPQSRPDSTFRHSDHRDVGCLNCHSTDESHGRVSVTTLNDCRSCHHRPPVSADCTACHEAGPPAAAYDLTRTLSISPRGSVQRALPFDHAPHEGLQCGECHTDGLGLSAEDVSCTACHEDHHQPEGVRCASCHEPVPASAHPSEQVHVGCSGSGCHTAIPIEGVPRSRDFCLGCHQDQEDHRPGRNCAECHQLPPPRSGGGGG